MSADGTLISPAVAVSLDLLDDSPYQTRTEYRDLDGLAALMRAHGQIGTALGRPKGDGRVELVSGHRSKRAAALAGLDTLNIVVREMSDEEAEELVAVTNIRDGLTPIEEARALGRMRDGRGWSPERLAERLGKSTALVRRRLSLLSLSHDAIHALEQGLMITANAEGLTLLVDPNARASALRLMLRGSTSAGFEPMGARAGREVIARFQCSLASAPWDLSDANLVPLVARSDQPSHGGACTTCPHRSSTQLPLIGEAIDVTDRCLNAPCYEAKRKAWFEANPPEEPDERVERRDVKPEKKPSPPPLPPTPTSKPAEVIDREIRDLAKERAIGEIGAAVRRRKWTEKSWQLHAIVLAVAVEQELPAVLERRGIARAEGVKDLDLLRAWVKKTKGESDLRALCFELAVIAADIYGTMSRPLDEQPVPVAARALGVDLDAIRAKAEADVRKEAPKPPTAKEKIAPKKSIKSTADEPAKSEAKATRSGLVNGDVHQLIKVASGAPGRPPKLPICKVEKMPEVLEPLTPPERVTCTGCRAAWAARG
jgi:ParB/RepB/Spo0J family partition protein